MDNEIDKQIEEVASSAIEFRTTLDRIIFKKLRTFFQLKNKEISRESKLTSLFDKTVDRNQWYEMEVIGMRIPGLRRNRAHGYLTAIYLLTAILTWTIFLIKNAEVIIAPWGLPIVGILITVSFSPVVLLGLACKKSIIPVTTIEHLVDAIIKENWGNLLADDKRLFKEILKKELSEERTSA